VFVYDHNGEWQRKWEEENPEPNVYGTVQGRMGLEWTTDAMLRRVAWHQKRWAAYQEVFGAIVRRRGKDNHGDQRDTDQSNQGGEVQPEERPETGGSGIHQDQGQPDAVRSSGTADLEQEDSQPCWGTPEVQDPERRTES
jgi:hypothetical protein